ncbi:LolA family protein [Anianabacter salinae]|uniref:LolA family protein n=1 Tax=Anianabacter salinae TaxID=2851023 RepID=UPI00225E527F|nr:outer membrane lipoprotein carrier protein LolA [Anianabacter salinae]MBV0913337.1 outer membrane lipoprotein carrier protein LolA [Anianabacter salinae]
MTRLTRRALLAALPAAALAPAVFAQDQQKLPLADISSYLNGLQTVSTAFTQVNADGTISTGTLYIQRPGRARFEYEPPNEALVMAGGQQVAIFDDRSNSAPEQYPLSRTPLNLILDRNVDLDRANMVVGHDFDGTATTVVAQDPAHPEYGTIALRFTGPPVELRQWVITNGDGTETTVVLDRLVPRDNIPAILFSIPQEMAQRGQ